MKKTSIYKDITGKQLNDLLTIISRHSTMMSVARYCDSEYSHEEAFEHLDKWILNMRKEYDENINGFKDYLDKECSNQSEVDAYFDNIHQINLESIHEQKPLLLKEKNGLLSDLKDFINVEYSNNTPVTNGPMFEILYLKIDEVFTQLRKKLPNLFKFPYKINDNCYEDLAFYNEKRIVMAVCSHEKFAYFDLTDEVYELVSELGIFN